MKHSIYSLLLCILLSCNTKPSINFTEGIIERTDPSLDSIISADAKIEIIATELDWSEGPLWIEKNNRLLFSDVPRNTIYQWTEEKGKEIYLSPSGYTDTMKRGGETGSNGLLLNSEGNLVLCQHGNRQMASMKAPLDHPVAVFESLASTYLGKRFNSPNDAVFSSNAELFFTDPPYGLEKNMNDPRKEIPYQGVYKVNKAGLVTLLIDSITRPNGIAFFPGEKKLIIANSDPAKPYWYLYEVTENNLLTNGKIFCEASVAGTNLKGLPDGLKIDRKGTVFASGPGGVWIFNASGILLGKIKLSEAASNCALSDDEKTLFITNDSKVLRIKLRK